MGFSYEPRTIYSRANAGSEPLLSLQLCNTPLSQGGKDDRLGIDRSGVEGVLRNAPHAKIELDDIHVLDDRDSLEDVSRESVYYDSYVYRLPDLKTSG